MTAGGGDRPVAGIAAPWLARETVPRRLVARRVRFAGNSLSLVKTAPRGMTIDARLKAFEAPTRAFRVQDAADRPRVATIWARNAPFRRRDVTVGTRNEAPRSPDAAAEARDAAAAASDSIA